MRIALADQQLNSGFSVSPDGCGPIHIGMTRAQAEQVLGRLKDDRDVHSADCYYLTYRSPKGEINFMVTNGKIARIDISEGNVRTAEGAGIGDSEQRILQIYGKAVTVKQHHYVENGHYLIIASPKNPKHTLLFETDGAKVTSFRAGQEPEVEYVEGCE